MAKPSEWVPQISEFPEFNAFLDELTQFADSFKKLPYGILSLIVIALKDIKVGEEEEIDESDYHLFEKMYYFIAGAMLTKEDKNLIIRDEDIDSLEQLLTDLSTKISLLEGYYAGMLDAKFVDGEWLYGMTKQQASDFLKSFRKTYLSPNLLHPNMNDQYFLTDFVIASHRRRYNALQYLNGREGGFSHDLAHALWRGSGDEQDSVEELERKMSFFLTDLEQRGLIESEMKEYNDEWQTLTYMDTDGYYTVPTRRAGRYYTITERGRMMLLSISCYLGYRRISEKYAEEN
jgi:hypothetical protein